jgi:hypothetical protein
VAPHKKGHGNVVILSRVPAKQALKDLLLGQEISTSFSDTGSYRKVAQLSPAREPHHVATCAAKFARRSVWSGTDGHFTGWSIF